MRLRRTANSAIDRCAFALVACGLATVAALALDMFSPLVAAVPFCAAAALASRRDSLREGLVAAAFGLAVWVFLRIASSALALDAAALEAGVLGGGLLASAAAGSLARRASEAGTAAEAAVTGAPRQAVLRLKPRPAPEMGPLHLARPESVMAPPAPARADPPSAAAILGAALASRVALVAECAELRRSGAEARALHERLFDTAPEALLLVAEDGGYLDANPAAEALLGYGRAELIGMRIGDIPAIGGVWTDLERARFVREGHWSGRMAMRRRDGRLLAVEVRVVAVPLPVGMAYIAALVDRSRRRGLERIRSGLRLTLGPGR